MSHIGISLDINKKLPDMKKSKNSNVNNILLASIVASLNVIFATNYSISMIIILLELMVLTYYFIKKDMTSYIGMYLMFLCLSFEFDVLVGVKEFYGFKNFRIFGINLGIIALLPVLLKAIFKGIKIEMIKREYPKLYKFCKTIIFINVVGIISGLFQILINDNFIRSMEGFVGDFIGISYSMILMPLLLIISIAYLISWEREKLRKLRGYLIAILIGVVISMIVSLATESFGQYGGIRTLLVTNVIRYTPFMLLFPFYKTYKSAKGILIFGVIGAILTITYNATGKMIILYMLVPFGVIALLWKNMKRPLAILILSLSPIVIIASVKVVAMLRANSVLFDFKLNQVLSILKFWEPNWIMDMPLSPRTRIIEFISIAYEYIKKPWFFILGKGYMGTITDHTGILNAQFILGGYSMNQWVNGTFYRVHETLNLLFLYHGLFGICFYVYMIKEVLKSFTKSPWILIGGFWFLMVYGFSVTMTAFGITALLLGYIEIEHDWGGY